MKVPVIPQSVITPTLLVSPSGCGKTMGVKAIANDLKRPFLVLIAGQHDSVDMCGVMAKDPSDPMRCYRTTPDWWLQACMSPCVILVDELTAANPDQVNAALRVSDDSRELNGHVLHPKTLVYAACNPPEMAAGSATSLPPPVLSRFRKKVIGPEFAVNWMVQQPGLVGVVGGYLCHNIKDAMASPEEIVRAEQNQNPFSCPRQWTRAAMDEPNDFAAWEEFIGPGAVNGWITFNENKDIPRAEDIINGSDKRVPQRADGCVAVAWTLEGHMRGGIKGKTKLRNVFEWFAKVASDGYRAPVAPPLEKIVGYVNGADLKDFAKTLNEFGDLIAKAMEARNE